MCHLDRRLISIKRVDDAESSISTVTGEKARGCAESTRETLRGGRACSCNGEKGRINNDDNSGLLRARAVGGRIPGPRYSLRSPRS